MIKISIFGKSVLVIAYPFRPPLPGHWMDGLGWMALGGWHWMDGIGWMTFGGWHWMDGWDQI